MLGGFEPALSALIDMDSLTILPDVGISCAQRCAMSRDRVIPCNEFVHLTFRDILAA